MQTKATVEDRIANIEKVLAALVSISTHTIGTDNVDELLNELLKTAPMTNSQIKELKWYEHE